jgi:hypothetical protein
LEEVAPISLVSGITTWAGARKFQYAEALYFGKVVGLINAAMGSSCSYEPTAAS